MLDCFYITSKYLVHILLQLEWLPSICNPWISRQLSYFPQDSYIPKTCARMYTCYIGYLQISQRKHYLWDFSGVWMSKTPCSQWRGLGSTQSVNNIPHATAYLYSQKWPKILRATTNTWHSQINEQGLPWWSSGKNTLAIQGTQVRSLVRELRSHVLQGT